MSFNKDILQVGNPRFCDIVISNRCCLHCKMCKAWQCGPGSNEISFDEAKKFVESLSGFVKEPLEINVMGGEPLLKDWCLDLCSFIAEKGFRSIISTNAYLIDEDMAKRIAGSGLNVLAISLESLNPETHNYYRGEKDVFSKAMKAIENIRKFRRPDMAITILTIIMEKNLDELLALVEWVNKDDLLVNVSFLALLETGLVQNRHNWFKSETYKDLWPQDTAKLCRLMDKFIALRKNGYKIWNPVSQLEAFKEYYAEPDKFMAETEYKVHDYILDLDENGIMYLSGDVLGNIEEDNIRELWFSEKANQIRKKIDVEGPGKRCCVINFICAFPQDAVEVPKKECNQVKIPSSQEKGFKLLDERKFDDAIEEFKRTLELDCKNEHAHHGLARCYQEKREYGKALEKFREGLRINPESEHIHQSLGFYYKDLAQHEKAEQEFRKVLLINPHSYQAHLGFGFIYLWQKEVDRAIAEFDEVLRLNPKNKHAYQGIGSSYQQKEQYDKAINYFEKAIEIDPNNEYGYADLMSCYEGLIKQGNSIDEIKAMYRGNSNPHIYYSFGLYYLKQRDFSKAVDEFNRALAIEPDNIRFLLEKAVAYFLGKRYKEASKLFYEILKIELDNKDALRYLEEIEQPDFCVIEVSHRCSFKCKMCNYWKAGEDTNEVSIEEFRKFISSLKDFVSTPFGLNISGGEPLLKKGILELIEFIAQEGFKFSMVTNAYLINRQIARRIADSGLNFLAISLDSLDERIHDNLRGVKGAYRKVMDALKYFDEYRGNLQNLTIQTIIMGGNIDGLIDFAEWIHNRNLSLSFMALTRPNMVPVDPLWYKKAEFSPLWPKDIKKVHQVMDGLIKLKNSGYRIDNPVGQLERYKLYFQDPERFVRETPCSLGDDIMHVNPKGEIYLCCEMEPIGNIKQADIGELWVSKKAEDIRQQIRLCKRNCAGMVNCYREVS